MSCYITIFSETGFPHAGIMLEVDGQNYWLSFGPYGGVPSTGFVVGNSRFRDINNYVRYKIPCYLARRVLFSAHHRWDGTTYLLGVRDCVSFAAEMASDCGLLVNPVNFTPYGLVLSIALANPGYSEYNATPFPFTSSASALPGSPAYYGSGPIAGPGVAPPNFAPPI